MCGITGIISKNKNINYTLYNSLFHIQHRGQDSHGVLTSDKNNFYFIKENGLINNSTKNISILKGDMGIGHVRYKTTGNLVNNEIQPFIIQNMSLCHNGNISNYQKIDKKNINLKTKSDSELILILFYNQLNKYKTINNENIVSTVKYLSNILIGSYSIIILIQNYGLICFKDPHGIRPLIYGKKDDTYLISSESPSLINNNFNIIEDVKGGEVIIFKNKNNTIKLDKYIYKTKIQKPCIFEWIYISREDSIINNVSVYEARLKMGEYLANNIKNQININEIDYIVPIPTTSKPIALKIAEVLQKPYRECIIKNRYIYRTFIMNNQMKRNKNIQKKLSVVKNIVKDKNLLIIDDSIVRGNTIKHIVQLLKKNNVNKIFVASCAPIIKYQNYYGLDIPTKTELIANNKKIKEIEKLLNIDKLVYQSVEDICKSIQFFNPNLNNFELSIFNGEYL